VHCGARPPESRQLNFQPNRGAPPSAVLPRLASWTTNGDAGVKYFSGTAAYHQTFDVPRAWLAPGSRADLDLGSVKSVAEILVNGHSLGVLWKAPYRIDLTGAVNVGANDLEIRVTNLWPNRMIATNSPVPRKLLLRHSIPTRRIHRCSSPDCSGQFGSPLRSNDRRASPRAFSRSCQDCPLRYRVFHRGRS
jgi:hypothetical protein